MACINPCEMQLPTGAPKPPPRRRQPPCIGVVRPKCKSVAGSDSVSDLDLEYVGLWGVTLNPISPPHKWASGQAEPTDDRRILHIAMATRAFSLNQQSGRRMELSGECQCLSITEIQFNSRNCKRNWYRNWNWSWSWSLQLAQTWPLTFIDSSDPQG